MGKRAVTRVMIACLTAALLGCGLAAPPQAPHYVGVYHVQAGHRYWLTYATEVDSAPVGARWSGGNLVGSPLASMSRPALILKADDFGGDFSYAEKQFIDVVVRHRALASLGLMTAQMTRSASHRRAYRALAAADFELWFHGHNHICIGPRADFAGRSVDDQIATFEQGITAARDLLGVEFHSFGAPCNAIDDNTAEAMRAMPQLTTWIFGIANRGIFVLPRLIDMESSPGRVRPANDVLADINALLDSAAPPDAITLQLHPARWGYVELPRFEEVLGQIAAAGRLRYGTPFGYWSWIADRDTIELTKMSATEYVLDASAASVDQRIDTDPAVGPVPSAWELYD
jgi:hypothetical protein